MRGWAAVGLDASAAVVWFVGRGRSRTLCLIAFDPSAPMHSSLDIANTVDRGITTCARRIS